jgi:hypothetical protein
MCRVRLRPIREVRAGAEWRTQAEARENKREREPIPWFHADIRN